ncbi:hypothetical protein K9L67_00550 [Candidatus Woesearchaeota archaeon]|nr:hypothetical protein [Candidatus Woesearchaeota archaeon]MCF7900696.1 hypothetical protein [Candidatus Woesearchaeota archaeon]MCF8013217.1 hypothetical protein [Candidatus Woesearchaeota archaeon]
MAASAFGGAIEFMQRVGVFDTVLPFLLVFTLVFAFLEKTKVLGTEPWRSDIDHKFHQVTRKNMNAMIAFVIAFFVVASSQLVALISELTSKIVLIMVLILMFSMTVGVMSRENKEGFELPKGWITLFTIIIFIAITAIFLDAMGWLNIIYGFLDSFWGSEATASVILIAIIIGIIFYITKDNKPKEAKKEKKDD